MALIFRWYLGMSSRWPISGDDERKSDYQIWCGPAIGAFNEWVNESFLADLNNRTVTQIGLNLLEGAAIATRAQQARLHGIDVLRRHCSIPAQSGSRLTQSPIAVTGMAALFPGSSAPDGFLAHHCQWSGLYYRHTGDPLADLRLL